MYFYLFFHKDFNKKLRNLFTILNQTPTFVLLDKIVIRTMKKIKFLAFAFFMMLAVSTFAQSKKVVFKAEDYASFGEKFKVKKVYTNEYMLKKYKALKKGDTITVQFMANIKAVCKKKGCWMNLDLSNNQEAFVKFKDYAFFVPLNADGSTAIISGKAYVDIVPVAELKHYAKDAGKPQSEIDKITEPEVTYAFMADGVYIKK